MMGLTEKEFDAFITMSRQLYTFWKDYPPKRFPQPEDYEGYEKLLELLEAAMDDLKDGRPE